MRTQSAVPRSTQETQEELRALLRSPLIERLFEGRQVTAIEEGGYFPDQNNPGKWVIRALRAGGIETFYDATRADDAQSGPVDELHGDERTCAERPALSSIAAAPEDCWSEACDSDSPANHRVRALQECLLADNSRAVGLMVDELHRDDAPDEWRDAIVFAAENVHFKDPEQQARVRSRLRELALQLRELSRAGTEHVVWSAMRRFSSLTPPEEANDLLEFLDRKGVVDTRMVALQCIARLFHAAPPSDPAALEPLAGRVAEYAEKFLDRDVFAGGENSSIARNALLALAALGSPKLQDCVARVNVLGRRWLSRQVRRQLQELLDSWESHRVEPEGNPAFKVVEAARATVQTAEIG